MGVFLWLSRRICAVIVRYWKQNQRGEPRKYARWWFSLSRAEVIYKDIASSFE